MRNEQTSVSQTYHRRGSKEAMGAGGEAPSRWEIFCNSLGKTSYFNAIGSQFTRVYNHFKKLDFLHVKVK